MHRQPSSIGARTARTPGEIDRELWAWYALLLVANALDLALTYLGHSAGVVAEANPLARPHLNSWWPLWMKVIPLAGLALGISVDGKRGRLLRRPTLQAVRLATAAYGLILALHVATRIALVGGG